MGPRDDPVPAPRLGRQPPTVLGLPDPGDPLRGVRHRPRSGEGPAGGASGGPPVHAGAGEPAGRRGGLAPRAVPLLREARPPGDRYVRYLRGVLLVLPSVPRPEKRPRAARPGKNAPIRTRGPVRRRGRARLHAPHLRPFLPQVSPGQGTG